MGDTPSSEDTVVYLNHAGQAPLSDQVKEVGYQSLDTKPWRSDASGASANIRRTFASFIGQGDEDGGANVAIVPSTAFAITMAAENIRRTLGDKPGASVLLVEDQFCSAVYAWQATGLALEIVPYPTSDFDWTQFILMRIASDTENKIVVACLPPLHWTDGSAIDLERIGAACQERGIELIVDATQAVGIYPIDISKIKPAMLACSVHKWLRCPSGASLVYVNPSVHDSWMPLDQHGRGRINGENPPNAKDVPYYPDARKFDSGGKPNPLLLPMMDAALTEVQETIFSKSLTSVQDSLEALVQPLLDFASESGYEVRPGPRAWHIVGLRHPDLSAETLAGMCAELNDKYRIIAAVRSSVLRISVYVTTTPQDINRLVTALRELTPKYSSG